MHVEIGGIMRATLKARIKRAKVSIAKRQKLLIALEKELLKYQKRAKKR